MRLIRRLVAKQSGRTPVEYALLVSFILFTTLGIASAAVIVQMFQSA